MRILNLVTVVVIAALVLSGCARMGASTTTRAASSGGLLGSSAAPNATVAPAQTTQQMATANPAAVTTAARSSTNIGGFVDTQVAGSLSEKEKSEAASAQFYALQFGRPGAPRMWQGDKGASGEVRVGPYVRVNQLDCREFTHVVTTDAGEFSKTGMACREADGRWSVTQS